MTDAPDRPTRSYSTAEVAQRLGVSVPTVQRWVDSGHLSAWKTPGGHRRVDAESAEQLFKSQQQARTLPAARADDPPPISVVLVDDNPDDRDVLGAVVQAALPQAQLRAFENGFQALVAIGRAAPTIVVTDIVMPHMDGLEMLRQLAAQGAARPRLIVAVSANCDARGNPAAALPPGVHFIPKPVRPEDLIALLRSVVTGDNKG